eukprot:Skav224986  [mRNA]  locus=scaffold560:234305:237555:+ [translate_table: standard]
MFIGLSCDVDPSRKRRVGLGPLALSSSNEWNLSSFLVLSAMDLAVQRDGNTRRSSKGLFFRAPEDCCNLTVLSMGPDTDPSICAMDLMSPGTTLGCATVAIMS